MPHRGIRAPAESEPSNAAMYRLESTAVRKKASDTDIHDLMDCRNLSANQERSRGVGDVGCLLGKVRKD